MKIEDRNGQDVAETTVTVSAEEIIDLLQGLADVIEGTREHLHFVQAGGPQLVVKLEGDAAEDPIGRQVDWWLGPLVLVGSILSIVGLITLLRWAAGLIA